MDYTLGFYEDKAVEESETEVRSRRRRRRRGRRMERYFGNPYRGDPGVPHCDPERFGNIWIGAFAYSAIAWAYPYMWQLSNQFNYHDKAMLYEQYHWKKAMKKNQKYEFLWNKSWDKVSRDAYYQNWPVYFP